MPVDTEGLQRRATRLRALIGEDAFPRKKSEVRNEVFLMRHELEVLAEKLIAEGAMDPDD